MFPVCRKRQIYHLLIWKHISDSPTLSRNIVKYTSLPSRWCTVDLNVYIGIPPKYLLSMCDRQARTTSCLLCYLLVSRTCSVDIFGGCQYRRSNWLYITAMGDWCRPQHWPVWPCRHCLLIHPEFCLLYSGVERRL